MKICWTRSINLTSTLFLSFNREVNHVGEQSDRSNPIVGQAFTSESYKKPIWHQNLAFAMISHFTSRRKTFLLFFLLQLLLQSKHKKSFSKKKNKERDLWKDLIKRFRRKVISGMDTTKSFLVLNVGQTRWSRKCSFERQNVISEIRTDFVLILWLLYTLRLKHVFEV